MDEFLHYSDPKDDLFFPTFCEDIEDRLEDHPLLPFAIGPGGDLLCFDYSGAGRHKIVWWYHETGKLHPVAENFDEFLAGLRP